MCARSWFLVAYYLIGSIEIVAVSLCLTFSVCFVLIIFFFSIVGYI